MEEPGGGGLPSRCCCIILFISSINSGDKSEHQVLAENLVDATSLPVAVPNYRLSPRISLEESNESDIRHPIHALDIALALSAIQQSEHLSSITDVSRMFLIGPSCGAHMISSLLLRPPA